MALTDEGNGGIPATMLVGPTTFGNAPTMYPYPVYGGGNGGGNGMFGGDGSWIILLIIVLLAANGGWGNNNGGGFGGQPIIVNDGNGGYQRGFDQLAVMAGINGVQTGVQNLATQLCGCCGDISTQLCNGFNGVAQQMYANTIADLERSFAAQTANTQGMNALQAQFAQCCCDNRLATESLRATVLSENCADRYEAANNTRDIIDSQTRGVQSILDKLCQLELDNYRRENENLRSQLNITALRESQTAQTAQILAGQTATVDAIYNRLDTCPIGTTPVFGRTPIFSCPTNVANNCGCGCGNNGF